MRVFCATTQPIATDSFGGKQLTVLHKYMQTNASIEMFAYIRPNWCGARIGNIRSVRCARDGLGGCKYGDR